MHVQQALQHCLWCRPFVWVLLGQESFWLHIRPRIRADNRAHDEVSTGEYWSGSTGQRYLWWSPRRSNQSILKEINPEYSLEGLMLILKRQYFSHLMWKADSLKKTPVLGKIEGRRRRMWQGIRWLDGVTDSMDMNLSELQETVEDRGAYILTEQ